MTIIKPLSTLEISFDCAMLNRYKGFEDETLVDPSSVNKTEVPTLTLLLIENT